MPYSWEITEHSDAPVERVWELLTDARGWKHWARFAKSDLVADGTPEPDGVGAVRVFGTGPFTSREQVVAFEAPTHFAYVLLRGLPIVGYRADVCLEPDADGTKLTWKSAFERPKVPGSGAFYRWFLRTFVRDTARRLCRAAVQPVAEATP